MNEFGIVAYFSATLYLLNLFTKEER